MSRNDSSGNTTAFLLLSEPVTAICKFVDGDMIRRLRRFYLT